MDVVTLGAAKASAASTYAKKPSAWTPFFLGKGSQRALLGSQDHPAVYDSTNRKTYISFLDRSRGLTVKEFNHATGTFSRDLRLSDYPAGVPMYDDHGVPSMCLTSDGKVNIIFGDHGIAPITARASTARTVQTTFTTATASSLTGTYHMLVAVGTDIYCLYRSGGSHGVSFPSHEFAGLAKSTNGMSTWTTAALVDCHAYSADAYQDFYPGSFDLAPNGRLAFSFAVAHGASHDATRSDIFHAQYDPTTGHVYAVDGTDLGTIIDTSGKFASCKVATVATGQVPRQAFHGTTGRPVITWVQVAADSKIGTSVAAWTGSAWTVTDLGTRTKHILSMSAIRWDSDDARFEAYAATGRSSETIITASTSEAITYNGIGCDFQLFTSPDGVTWTSQGIVLDSGQVQGVGINSLVVPTNSARELKALVQPGAIGNSSGAPPNNGSLIGSSLPFYGLTDRVVDPIQVARNPNGPIEMALSPHIVLATSTASSVVASGTYTTLAMGSILPPNTTHALVSATVQGTGTAGRFEVRLRQSYSAVDYSVVIYGDGAESGDRAYQVWVPIQFRSFDWRWSGNLSTIAFRIVAIRVDGPVTTSG